MNLPWKYRESPGPQFSRTEVVVACSNCYTCRKMAEISVGRKGQVKLGLLQKTSFYWTFGLAGLGYMSLTSMIIQPRRNCFLCFLMTTGSSSKHFQVFKGLQPSTKRWNKPPGPGFSWHTFVELLQGLKNGCSAFESTRKLSWNLQNLHLKFNDQLILKLHIGPGFCWGKQPFMWKNGCVTISNPVYV